MTRGSRFEGQGFVLNVFKDSPWTSHGAVQRVRRILNFRKVGHTGTLDPFATGVLLCCVGRATKLSNVLMDLPKTYEGWMRFGVKTNTGDSSGDIEQEWDLPVPPREALEAATNPFEGDIQQVPPMVSALKHQGRRLYELARSGITVERKARRVHVASFAIAEVSGPRIRFRVECTRGTYVRTLVEDYGRVLGAGACVDELCRTAVGSFRASDAIHLSEELGADDLLQRSMSMAGAIQHLPAWKVPPFWAAKLRRGHAPPWVVLQMEEPPIAGTLGRLVSTSEELLALAKAVPTSGLDDRPWYDALELQLVRVI